jgi:hypothetical protein
MIKFKGPGVLLGVYFSVVRLTSATGVGEGSRWAGRSSITANTTIFIAFWATTTAPASPTGGRIGVIAVSTPPSSANGNGNTLDYSSMVMANRIHSVVNRKVTTDEIRAHRGVLTGKCLCLADDISLVFAVINAHHASVASWTRVGLVVWVRPATPSAETYMDKLLVMNQIIMHVYIGNREKKKKNQKIFCHLSCHKRLNILQRQASVIIM